ncbi:MAG TPA: DinB family protein [Bryobacteraceae bacterium]|nr:DinB family protein [Bryobacteraceae bacterium]
MTAQEAQGLAKYLFQTLETEFATTRKVLAAVPAEQLNFKLGEKGRTAAELMWHMVQSDVGFAEGIANLNFDNWRPETAPPQTTAEILAAFDRDIPPVFEKVKSLTPEQLATPVNFMNFMTLPVVIYVGWWANHIIHHRGQLSTYLRAMNAHVPGIYGGSADEPFEAAATA